MPLFGWIRDLFGILNDAQAAKKTRLEIEKIEDEKREKLVTPATLEDVKKYDPKTRLLLKKIAQIIIEIIFLLALILALLASIHLIIIRR